VCSATLLCLYSLFSSSGNSLWPAAKMGKSNEKCPSPKSPSSPIQPPQNPDYVVSPTSFQFVEIGNEGKPQNAELKVLVRSIARKHCKISRTLQKEKFGASRKRPRKIVSKTCLGSESKADGSVLKPLENNLCNMNSSPWTHPQPSISKKNPERCISLKAKTLNSLETQNGVSNVLWPRHSNAAGTRSTMAALSQSSNPKFDRWQSQMGKRFSFRDPNFLFLKIEHC
jgi:hypothetical protein